MSIVSDRECLRCLVHFSSALHGVGACPDCGAPFRALATLARTPAGVPRRKRPTAVRKALHDYDQPTAGHPLGVGMPMGSPLRLDGESHGVAWRRVLRGDVCCYCLRRPPDGEPLTIDHIVPLVAGGPNTIANLAGACGACNREKSGESLLLYLLATVRVRRRRAARPWRPQH